MTTAARHRTVPDAVRRAARSCVENRAENVVILDLHGVADMTDYFVIASGTSDTHVRALADHVMEDLATLGQRPYHQEGLVHGRWVLLDYVDFVVHVFHPAMREFYQLERLWGDARVVPVGAHGASA
ncbi:MAG TPA: ribosome silencing factor [Gemmatimonadaceae bacterium]|jgi:ribosome-associated protein|nr:ribosome silencing factor [Gemmatimonadaceae bacterium]